MLGKLYLTLYNIAQLIGWGYILYGTVLNYVEGHDPTQVWSKVGITLMYFQNAALLEVVHSLIGLVKASAFITAIQVASRILITSLICWNVADSRESYVFTGLMLSWSITEVVRYGYFAIHTLVPSAVPYALTWLRYSLFLVLYPTGVASEIGTIVLALPFIKETDMFGISMPNKFNFAFDLYIALIVIIIVYVPGLPKMYNHMRAQREKILGKPKQH